MIGHPIWGDFRYGPYDNADKIEDDISNITVDHNPHGKMCLWALEITFPHPCKEDVVHAQIDEPSWYEELRRAVCRKASVSEETQTK